MNGCENDSGRRYVALFIDWDNLAISTSADMGGAVPDVGKIVQKAREYGTVLVARAYAEWSVTSERLNVYRAGVEPAYAPTFRFEPDPSAPSVRSKSLADPCMVADAVEILHLMPMITDFVIVTGDKDMIPVVRLVQLRGKRVTVIGPDFVANVLREMADNFVSYRSLVEEDGQVKPAIAPTRERPARPERSLGEPIAEARRLGRGQPRQPEAPPALQPARPAGRPEPAQREAAPRAEGGREPRRRAPVVPTAPTPPPPVEPVVMAEPAPRPQVPAPVQPEEAAEATSPDLNNLFNDIVELLQRRAAEGKSRVRATAIKDALLQAYPGFNERNYGFSKFKDLLDAAQRAGLINIIRVGPVHWATLSSRPAGGLGSRPAGEAPSVQMPAEGTPLPAAGQPEAPQYTLSEERATELINFIRDLSNRSRWLTYTYILTNLSTLLGQDRPAAEAEAEARDLLAAMVQEGMLQVDAEPREIEVNGIRHRIRMCYLVETHPLVARILAEPTSGGWRPEPEPAATGEPIAAAEPLSPEEETQPQEAEGIEVSTEGEASEPAEETANEAEVSAVAAGATTGTRRGRSRRRSSRGGRREAGVAPTTAPAEELGEETQIGAEAIGPGGAASTATAEQPPMFLQAPSEGAGESTDQSSIATPQAEAGLDHLVLAPGPEAEEAPTAEGVAGAEPAAEAAEPREAEHEAAVPTREAAFAALSRIVRENVSPARPRLRATGLKQRLVRSLGHFNEHDYGFSRFGGFLEAAREAGLITLQREGPILWVAVPSEE